MTKRILLLGASGLIGWELLKRLATEPVFILLPVRRPEALATLVSSLPGVRAQLRIIPLDDLWQLDESVDVCYSALGTTQKVAGKAGLKAVDLELTIKSCSWACQHGAALVSVVSALGASRHSLFYYSRIKGQMEEQLQHLPVKTIHIWRPSVLLGKRPSEQMARPLEKLSGIMLGHRLWGRWQALPAASVAGAMLIASRQTRVGLCVFGALDIRRLCC